MPWRCRRLVALLFITLLVAPGAVHPADPAPPIPVVATIPVLKDFVEQIGGDRVSAVSLLSGLENEHTYSPKPSDILAIRKARLFVQVGVGLEVWAAPLVKNAGHATLTVVTTARGIAIIRDPGAIAPAAGEPEHEGNPHVWLDPENAKIMVRHLTEALSAVEPAHADTFRANQAAYLHRLDGLQRELDTLVSSVRDRQIVVHHPAWPYFARRFRFEIVGTVVNQSGAEPSAQHLQALINTIRQRHVRVIVSEPQLNQKIPEMLARETGARVLVLTPLPGGLPGTASYLDLLRYNVTQLARALS